jgi:hypothetical protein
LGVLLTLNQQVKKPQPTAADIDAALDSLLPS